MKISFLGACRMVTGSCYLIETNGEKVLVDCGMFQGSKEVTRLNYEGFGFNPEEISYVFLTHAHIDHSGLLPKLYAEGFYGRIVSTGATADLCKIMLEDAADMHEHGTEHENRRREEEGLPPRKPLYTKRDARGVCRQFDRVNYDETYEGGCISVRYFDAGHILGSAIIEMSAEGKKIVFSGDIGQWGSPIVRDPTLIREADYLLMESTYGNRLHQDVSERANLLAEYARETYKRGGKLLIPSFAVERTQELLYTIKKLKDAGEFPQEEVFLDSPLAMRATNVFVKHRECYDWESLSSDDPMGLDEIQYTGSVEASKKLNHYSKPCIIIAGSGMCTGGRIKHHLKNSLYDSRNMVLFVGYQAEGTLGRVILEGAKRVRLLGVEVDVNAEIRSIDGFSAHADRNGLLTWVKGFKRAPKITFIVHGEPDAAEALKEGLERGGFYCRIPSMLQTIRL